jgi:hypothetical protein
MRDVLRRGVAERSRSGADREHPAVAALDRSAEEIIERADRREPSMPLLIGEELVDLRLAAWEQAFHTPMLALVTMLHRHVVIAHGTADAWTDIDESRLLEATLRDGGNEPVLLEIAGAGHDLGDADVDDFANALAARMEPRELPPVLVAIEQMANDGPA